MLEVQNLTKVYADGTVGLNDISLTIPQGEFLVVIGLSGSGKSTFLRCLNRLIEPSGGSITLDGMDVTRAGPRQLRRIRGKIGMIFQHFNLVKRRSVLENVLNGALGASGGLLPLLGFWPVAKVEEAKRNLERVGIGRLLYQRADALSGGQMQRVAIARALMQHPQILLADEPVASLDPATSDSVMQYLQQLNREDGVTIIASLHFLSLARKYATRVVALKDGVVMFDGPAADIDKDRFQEIYGEDAEEVEIR